LQLPDPATNQSVSQFHCLVSTSAIKDGRCSTLTQGCEAGVTSNGAKKAPAVRVYRGREKGAGNWCFEAHNETGRPIDVELVGTCCSPPLVEWVDHLDLRFIPSFIGCAPLTGPPKNPPAMKGNLAMLKPNGSSGAIGKSCITVPEDTKLSKLYCFLDGAMVQDSDLGSLGTPITHPDFGQVYIGRMSGRNLLRASRYAWKPSTNQTVKSNSKLWPTRELTAMKPSSLLIAALAAAAIAPAHAAKRAQVGGIITLPFQTLACFDLENTKELERTRAMDGLAAALRFVDRHPLPDNPAQQTGTFTNVCSRFGPSGTMYRVKKVRLDERRTDPVLH